MYEDFKTNDTKNSNALTAINNRAPHDEELIPIKYELMHFPEAKEGWRHRNQRIASALMQSRRDIDNLYAKVVGEAYDSVTKSQAFLRPPDPSGWFLKHSLVGSGHHSIRFTINNASSDFAVTVALQEVFPDGKLGTARSLDFDSTTTPDSAKAKRFAFYVRYPASAGK
jgi:hypothetical protein